MRTTTSIFHETINNYFISHGHLTRSKWLASYDECPQSTKKPRECLDFRLWSHVCTITYHIGNFKTNILLMEIPWFNLPKVQKRKLRNKKQRNQKHAPRFSTSFTISSNRQLMLSISCPHWLDKCNTSVFLVYSRRLLYSVKGT